jgi:hypothetical protein
MYRVIELLNPSVLDTEYPYHNPENVDNDPKWDWKFDVYFEIGERKIAIEIDGKKGHNSKKSKEKRDKKIEYLRTQGIELYAWSPKWINGKKKLPTELFLEEMNLLQPV